MTQLGSYDFLFFSKATQASSALAALRGDDPSFRHALNIALRAAASDCSVLIIGETGTGKELVARVIHEASPRRKGPMVAVNCGAIAEQLIGSELFGHEKGAFTGASTDRDGVFVQADGGTLFLDELGELPLDQQPHLLRVLETRTVRRLGGNSEEPVDVRLVAATNRLEHLGTPESPLRLDLFHRLATVVVRLPPLRERPGDIPLLIRAFMEEFTPAFGRHTISRATMHELTRYPWPGNVRELRQAVKRAMALCPEELTLDELLQHRGAHLDRIVPEVSGTPSRSRYRRRRKRPAVQTCPIRAKELRPIDIIIRDVLCDALEKHSSIRSAAESLGLAKSTFADWARRYGIDLD